MTKKKIPTKATTKKTTTPRPVRAASPSALSGELGPADLPPPKRKRGRPTKEEAQARAAAQPPSEPTVPPIIPDVLEPDAPREVPPADTSEFDRAIAPYRLQIKMALTSLSSLFRALGEAPLSSEEMQSGVEAWGAWCYQQRVSVDASMAIAIWSSSVAAPRLLDYLERRKKQRQQEGGGIPSTADVHRARDEARAAFHSPVQ